MTDDVPAQITLYPPSTDIEISHWGSLAPTLWHSGLIWHDYEQVAIELPQPELRIWCTFTDRYAFQSWREHSLVIERCSELLGTHIVVVETITPWDRHDRVCNCDDSSALILMGHGFGNRKAIIFCCDCLGYYPNYRTSELLGQIAPDLQAWALVSGHVYDIWMLTADLESWALNELQSPNSNLNTSGQSFSQAINALTDKPTWYYIFVESGRRNRDCPSCRQACGHPKWSNKRFVCRECQLVY
jgi:hypothetical protein